MKGGVPRRQRESRRSMALHVKRSFVDVCWIFLGLLFRIRYRFEYKGVANIPENKAVLLVGNHVSWIDWFILQLPFKRRINYLIDKEIYNRRLFNWVLRFAELIPISKKASKDSFAVASMRLKDGKIVAIFPEGEIARNGDVAKFYRGYEYIDTDGAFIVPFYIEGVFGSLFARYKGDAKRCFLKKREVRVFFGKPVAEHIKAHELREIVLNLKRN